MRPGREVGGRRERTVFLQQDVDVAHGGSGAAGGEENGRGIAGQGMFR